MIARCLALVSFALLASPTEAQTRRIVSQGWPTPPVAQPSDVIANSAPVQPAVSEDVGQDPEPVEAAPPVRPTPRASALQVFGRTDLRVSLPAAWAEGAADESRLPAYARYTFEAPAGELAGTVLRVERVVGLNPAEEQQWRGGRTPYGYHGARPVAALALSGETMTVFETAGAGLGGATLFTQRGRTFWAVSVITPMSTWNAQRLDVVALLSAVTIPAGEPVPGVVAAPRR